MKVNKPKTEKWHKYEEGDSSKPIKKYFKKGFWKKYDRKKFFKNLFKSDKDI